MPAPALPPPQAEYAYVVDVRPLDRCVVPHCSIRGRDVTGYKRAVELDGDLGAYVSHGKMDNELFFRRAVVLRKGETYAFDVPESRAPSELDFYLSAETSGDYRARLRISAQRSARAPEVLVDETFEGTTKAFVPRTKGEECGKIEEFERHVRMPLPSREGRMLRVVIENTADTPLALGSPLVLNRVEGRGPRQGFIVVFDAALYYQLAKLFTGTGDAPTEIFRQATAERGIFFPRGYSPANSTQLFVRRFFRNGYYANEGEPIVRGIGLDEEPTERVPTPIARFAENGFRTEQFVANFILNPDMSVTGVDGGYQNEYISVKWPELYHPRVLAARFEAWIAEHPRDDCFGIIWMSTTHDAVHIPIWGPNRKEVLGPTPPTLTDPKRYRADHVQWRWENLIDSADAVRDMWRAAEKHSPSASRLWFIGADHGLIQVYANERPARYPGSILPGGPQHRFFGSSEESWTPFALVYDGVARPPGGPRVVEDATMEAAAWRAFEKLFGVDLGLPETTSFDSPALSGEDAWATRWHDDGNISLAHANAVRVAVGKWGYRQRQPSFVIAPIWDQPASFQLMLGGGTERRSGPFMSEELYDDEVDPLEMHNIAGAHPDVVLAMRRRVQDFLSTYYDPPSHPRHRNVLTFAAPVEVVLEGPRPFKVRVDGEDVTMTNPRRVAVRGKRIEIIEDRDAMGIVSVKGPGIASPLLLRCASSGQPIDELSPERDRLDLVLARHNCATKSEASPPYGEVWFYAELVRSKASGVTGGANEEALEAFRRWGYVRDIDKKP